MRIKRPLAAALAGLLLSCTTARAWNATGHEAVAQVTWDRLTPNARAKLAAVLEQHPRRDKDLLYHPVAPGEDRGRALFLVAATWPDIIRSPTNPLSRTEAHSNWHYCDLPFDEDGKAGPVPVEAWDGHSPPENLVQALAMVTAELAAPARRPTVGRSTCAGSST